MGRFEIGPNPLITSDLPPTDEQLDTLTKAYEHLGFSFRQLEDGGFRVSLNSIESDWTGVKTEHMWAWIKPGYGIGRVFLEMTFDNPDQTTTLSVAGKEMTLRTTS